MASWIEQDLLQLLDVGQDEIEQRRSGLKGGEGLDAPFTLRFIATSVT
jgi:hypothetical protein